jgi:LmbE family N-acetylglucosaminyl deacetylase
MAYTNTALFIGAHNDDCEYGAGGLAYLLAKKGYKVVFLNVACKIHADLSGDAFALYYRQEISAANSLGAEKIIVGDRDGGIYEYGGENIRLIKEQIERLRPDLIYIHWPKDNHIEHMEVSKCSFAAISLAAHQASCRFDNSEVFAFEAGPYQTMVYFYPDFFINVESCMDKIRESLTTFDQVSANGQGLYVEKEVSARFRGHIAGWKYAEAYKIVKFPSGARDPELLLPKILKEDFRWAGNNFYPWGRQYFLQ